MKIIEIERNIIAGIPFSYTNGLNINVLSSSSVSFVASAYTITIDIPIESPQYICEMNTS